jgi:hypothetical protein
VTCEDNGLIEKLSEKLLECEGDLKGRKDDVDTWTDSLEELSEIEDAFKKDGKFKLRGKTILDIGTDCVKPLYIALKFKPKKIIGINEEFLYSYTSDIEQKSKLFAEETKIKFYDCSLFDKETLNRILKKEKVKNGFGFVLVSKTLHHLRTGECKRKQGEKHDCAEVETEKNCTYKFEKEVIFEKLLGLGKRVIVYEAFLPQEKDDDKVRGRGGYFTTKEWMDIFEYLLSRKHKVVFIRPEPFLLEEQALAEVEAMLRRVDIICFYVEKQDVKDAKNL